MQGYVSELITRHKKDNVRGVPVTFMGVILMTTTVLKLNFHFYSTP